MAEQLQLVEFLERFAATTAGTFEVNDVLHELGDTTVALLDTLGTGVSVVDDHNQMFVAATSESGIEIERSRDSNPAEPCIEAFRTGEAVVVSLISDLDRWPNHQRAADDGFESVVGLALAVGDRELGSLDIGDIRPRQWSEADLPTARVLAQIATTYTMRAGELDQVLQLSERLQHARDSRIVIERVRGMLARDHDIGVEQDSSYSEQTRASAAHRSAPSPKPSSNSDCNSHHARPDRSWQEPEDVFGSDHRERRAG